MGRKTTKPKEDLTGQKFNRLTVLGWVPDVRIGESYAWRCQCDCGNTCQTTSAYLKRGHTKSCGCYKIDVAKSRKGRVQPTSASDKTGMRYGKWLIIKRADPEKYGSCKWVCKCDCGTEIITPIAKFTYGESTHCGCLTEPHSGDIFNRLTVLHKIEHKLFACQCECGNIINVHQKDLKGNYKQHCGCLKNKSNRTKNLTRGQASNCEQKINNLLGKKSQNWVVIALDTNWKEYGIKWICQCECGNQDTFFAHDIRSINTPKCQKCGVGNVINNTILSVKNSYQHISYTLMEKIRYNAARRNIEFNITAEDLWQIYLQQKGFCALSGDEIIFPTRAVSSREENASLDRIDSNKPYTKDNVQWVTKIVNVMKQSLSNKNFVIMCKKIAGHNS